MTTATFDSRGRAPMTKQRALLLGLNVVGGTAVLGSYVHGIATHPGTAADAWGNVPEAWIPFYVINMFFAAAGYLTFTALVFFRLDPERVRVAGGFGYGVFHLLYLLILLPSALWMPLTYALLDAPSMWLWALVRLDLALVAAGSLGMLGALLTLDPRPSPGFWRAAVVGCLFFNLQTTVLDAVIWPAYFPI